MKKTSIITLSIGLFAFLYCSVDSIDPVKKKEIEIKEGNINIDVKKKKQIEFDALANININIVKKKEVEI